ncbi:contact-dependent growth inhibition system immunity protein [Amycolatopsis sp. NPDC049691]|uniref:contact-dependent growth inhibition system immunity protein n=1 Tax=Amycolatopsis sp. NPDC049691 TaxID=3155155 RepID=UPI00342FDE6A
MGNPSADATQLIKTAHELRHKPVGAMDTEDLRLLLLQQESVEVLVPIALTHLEQNHFSPGDLLTAALKIPQEYWQQHPTNAIVFQP